jgi:hypothetical protein
MADGIDPKQVSKLLKQVIKAHWLLDAKYMSIPAFENHLIRLNELSKRAIKDKTPLLLFVSL